MPADVSGIDRSSTLLKNMSAWLRLLEILQDFQQTGKVDTPTVVMLSIR
jgi:hypothetical protein